MIYFLFLGRGQRRSPLLYGSTEYVDTTHTHTSSLDGRGRRRTAVDGDEDHDDDDDDYDDKELLL